MTHDDLESALETQLSTKKISDAELKRCRDFLARTRPKIELALDIRRRSIPESLSGEILVEILRDKLSLILLIKVVDDCEDVGEGDGTVVLRRLLIDEWKLNHLDSADHNPPLNAKDLCDYLNLRANLIRVPEREHGIIAESIRNGLVDRERGNYLKRMLRRLVLDPSVDSALKQIIDSELRDLNFSNDGAERHRGI